MKKTSEKKTVINTELEPVKQIETNKEVTPQVVTLYDPWELMDSCLYADPQIRIVMPK